MCGGICGPTGSTSGRLAPSKSVKQRKVPYNNHNGTVIASYKTSRDSVEMYKGKNNSNYTVSWHLGLSSGAASYTRKFDAVREYNRKVPDKFKIKKW